MASEGLRPTPTELHTQYQQAVDQKGFNLTEQPLSSIIPGFVPEGNTRDELLLSMDTAIGRYQNGVSGILELSQGLPVIPPMPELDPEWQAMPADQRPRQVYSPPVEPFSSNDDLEGYRRYIHDEFRTNINPGFQEAVDDEPLPDEVKATLDETQRQIMHGTWGLEFRTRVDTKYVPETDPIATFDKLKALVDGRTEEVTDGHLFEGVVDIFSTHARMKQIQGLEPKDEIVLMDKPDGDPSAYLGYNDAPNDEEKEIAWVEIEEEPSMDYEFQRSQDGSVTVIGESISTGKIEPVSLSSEQRKEIATKLLTGYITTPPSLS